MGSLPLAQELCKTRKGSLLAPPRDWLCKWQQPAVIDPSKIKSGAELHLPHVGRRAFIGIEVRRGKLIDIVREVRMVQGVEHLPAQLEGLGLGELERFCEG